MSFEESQCLHKVSQSLRTTAQIPGALDAPAFHHDSSYLFSVEQSALYELEFCPYSSTYHWVMPPDCRPIGDQGYPVWFRPTGDRGYPVWCRPIEDRGPLDQAHSKRRTINRPLQITGTKG
ncbi:hypothetical protein DCAR_0831015 [Daucus carota subsp. sativus]|uniref:Uncharacterized protein n=1 Tax=Daucus carota subsp. sativus TaxID=79200 RepID=A0A175YAD9_DAUCS|nr:hypothetical protein DCAR_0831015 [Daucus carota subsp. sativus]